MPNAGRCTLVLALLVTRLVGAQEASGALEGVVKNVTSRVPGLYLASMRSPESGSILATFQDQPPQKPASGPPVDIRSNTPRILSVTLEASTSDKGADEKQKWLIDSTPTHFSRKEMRQGLTLYVWDQYGYRILTRVGTTVIDVSAPSALRNYVIPVLDSVAQQLEASPR
jgi:hypothetical protein